AGAPNEFRCLAHRDARHRGRSRPSRAVRDSGLDQQGDGLVRAQCGVSRSEDWPSRYGPPPHRPSGAPAQSMAGGGPSRCPAHDDRKRSLTVAVGDSGALLLKCHAGAGCRVEQIVAALGVTMADLFPRHGRQAGARDSRRRIVATYDYRDEQGNLLFQVVRYEPKDFRQRRPDGNGGWSWKLKGVRRVLYRLPELLAADPALPVYLVEGEKDVEALVALSLVATTNPGGARKWRPEYAEPLRGRDVVLLPDNDDKGRQHAEQVAVSLTGIAASVKVVTLP